MESTAALLGLVYVSEWIFIDFQDIWFRNARLSENVSYWLWRAPHYTVVLRVKL